MIRISAYPRIHIGLIDMNGCTGRVYGGMWFLFEGLPVIINLDKSSSTESVTSSVDSHIPHKKDIVRIVEYFEEMSGCHFQLRFEQIIPEHIGLGSKTATLLALTYAFSKLCHVKVDIAKICGRGGASGIGLNGFFSGGVVVDGGHSVSLKENIVPSRYGINRPSPPQIFRADFPSSWRVHIVIPAGKNIFGVSEKDFFSLNTPIPDIESYETLSLVYHVLTVAFIQEDYALLLQGLKGIRGTGFKSREIKNQNEVCRAIIETLDTKHCIAAGMTSMGPAIYAITKDREQEAVIMELANIHQAEYFGAYRGNNSGCKLEVLRS